jgi:hypothetical protein
VNPSKLVLPVTFYYLKSEFPCPTLGFDSLGNSINESPLYYSKQNDFLFGDGWTYPYEKIEIKEDSLILFYYTSQEITYKDFGLLTFKCDTLLFTNNRDRSFSGTIENKILKIPAYGYCFEKGQQATGSTELGIYNLQKFLNDMKRHSYERLFIQPFNMMYVSR